MGPVIQDLAITGDAKLYELTVSAAAETNTVKTIAPPTNWVAIIYELEFVPEAVNLLASLTGPNIAAQATVRPGRLASAGAYLAMPDSELTVTLENDSNSTAIVTIRWIQVTALRYRKLVNPSYHAEMVGWAETLAAADTLSGAGGGRRG